MTNEEALIEARRRWGSESAEISIVGRKDRRDGDLGVVYYVGTVNDECSLGRVGMICHGKGKSWEEAFKDCGE